MTDSSQILSLKESNMKLAGKVAIVTGGGAGIGKVLALGLAKEGADIVITDINEARLQEAERDISTIGVNVLALKSDVSVLADIQTMVDKTIERFGKIDILVNNAAVYDPVCPFLEKAESAFDRVTRVNSKGVFFSTQAVAKQMVKRNYGKIININSAHARLGIPGNSDYTGTKGAMLSITRTIAAELSPMGINVNSIACGLTPTEGYRESNYPQEMIDFVVGMTPLRRLGKPEDYVAMVVLLASDDASFITGQTISVDGGLAMP